MKLSDRHTLILKRAHTHGAFYPTNLDERRAAIELYALNLLVLDEVADNAGRTRYLPTSDGEVVAEELKTIPKASRVFVFNSKAA